MKPTANSQQPTANSQQPTACSLASIQILPLFTFHLDSSVNNHIDIPKSDF